MTETIIADFEFIPVNHRLHNGLITATPPEDTRVVDVAIALTNEIPRLRNQSMNGRRIVFNIQQILGCIDCPVFQQYAYWAEENITPQLGNRSTDENGNKRQEIICFGQDKIAEKIGGGLDRLPCYKKFRNRTTVQL